VPELDPFAGLAAVLGTVPIQVDPHRQARKGVPEVVYAAGKTPPLLLASVRDLLDNLPSGRVLVSRATSEMVALLREELEPLGASVLVAPHGAPSVLSQSLP